MLRSVLLKNGNDAFFKIWTGRILAFQNHLDSISGKRPYSVAREARFMKKLVTGARHSRKKWFTGQSTASALKEMSFLMQGQPGGGVFKDEMPKRKGGRVLRRVGVLSTVFMEHITEVLASGDLPYNLGGLGLEITEVRISSDFTHLNVYWYSSNPEKESQLETILKSSASHIRHTLSQLRLIGQVPPIVFVKDDKITRLMHVENIISNLDFGEDYKATPLGHNYKLAMASKNMSKKKPKGISEQLEKDLESLDDPITLPPPPTNEENTDSDTEEESNVLKVTECPSSPAVRQDMLGLDWERIMKYIKKEVAKTAKKQRDALNPTGVTSYAFETEETSAVDSPDHITASATRQKEFLQYLKQRRIQRSKAEKLHSTEVLEREFLAQEKELRKVELISQFDFEEYKEQEDYVDENLEFEDRHFNDWHHEKGNK